MAARVIAQMIMQVTAVASRAFVSAYQQALQNAKAGGGASAAANLGKAIRLTKMQSDEALKVLNIQRTALTAESLELQYKKYFEANDPKKGGSFYLQSKIYRAKEALDIELNPPKAAPEPPVEPSKTAAATPQQQQQQPPPKSSAAESDEARIRRERFEKFRQQARK